MPTLGERLPTVAAAPPSPEPQSKKAQRQDAFSRVTPATREHACRLWGQRTQSPVAGAPAGGAFRESSPTPAAMGAVSENPHLGRPPARPQDAPAAFGGAGRSLSPAPLPSELGRNQRNCRKNADSFSSQASEAVVK